MKCCDVPRAILLMAESEWGSKEESKVDVWIDNLNQAQLYGRTNRNCSDVGNVNDWSLTARTASCGSAGMQALATTYLCFKLESGSSRHSREQAASFRE
eukprot:scaffold10629_cov77-Skeletonema_dohrnii-CCMP3373.AAC.4